MVKVGNALLLVVSATVGLGACEGLARLMGEDMTAPMPLTSYVARPWGSVMDRHVAPDLINSHGAFDIEHSMEKPLGRIRLAILGDSFLGLPTLPHESQAPQMISNKLLNEGPCSGSCEVLNFSVSSAGTGTELIRYQLDARRFSPDLTVVFFTVSNDARNNSPSLQPKVEAAPMPLPRFSVEADGTLRQSINPAAPGSFVYYEGPVANFLVRNSALYRKLSRLWQIANGARSIVSSEQQWAITASFLQTPYTPEVKEAWDVTEAIFHKLKEEVEVDKGRLAVVLVPTSWDIETHWRQWLRERLPASMDFDSLDFDLPYREIKARLANQGIATLDLRPAFRNAVLQSASPPLYDDTGHWSPRGHLVAAEAATPFLAEAMSIGIRE